MRTRLTQNRNSTARSSWPKLHGADHHPSNGQILQGYTEIGVVGLGSFGSLALELGQEANVHKSKAPQARRREVGMGLSQPKKARSPITLLG